MTFPSPFAAGMRSDLTDLVLEWGKNSTIKRQSTAVLNAQGRLSGDFVTQITDEVLFVQPIAGSSTIVSEGIDDETTHLAYQKFSGFIMEPKDRVTVSGDSFDFDVVRIHVKESHRVTELKQITRS